VKIVTLSVAGLLGEAIKRIHSNESVNSLFEFKGGRTS
jgi:phosphoribosylpyrophosphate synthetase